MCMCVQFLVANLILLCSLKYISLLWNIFTRTWVIFILISFLFSFFLFLTLDLFCVHLFIFLHSPCLFLEQLLREILSRTWSIYSDETKQTYFLSSPSVGVEHFDVDENHVFAYFQCRSSTHI